MRIKSYLWLAARSWRLYFLTDGWRTYVSANGSKYKVVRVGRNVSYVRTFVADPFLFHHDGTNWLFYETVGPERVASGLKGKIGCFKEVGGKWVDQGVVLESPWHMSYPQVFEEDGHIYMIPEQSDLGKGDVSLYEATDFPRGWVKCATLINRPFADATLLRKDGHYYMACYTIPPHETAELWHAPTLLGPWARHPQWNAISQSRRLRRCGGSFIEEDGQLYRVAQDCNGFYGKRLFKVRIETISPDAYREGAHFLLTDRHAYPFANKHTYNSVAYGDRRIQVVDTYRPVIKPVGELVQTMRQLLQKHLGARHE